MKILIEFSDELSNERYGEPASARLKEEAVDLADGFLNKFKEATRRNEKAEAETRKAFEEIQNLKQQRDQSEAFKETEHALKKSQVKKLQAETMKLEAEARKLHAEARAQELDNLANKFALLVQKMDESCDILTELSAESPDRALASLKILADQYEFLPVLENGSRTLVIRKKKISANRKPERGAAENVD